MNVSVIGRGNVGGGLGRLWEQADHDVTTFGRDGGDASAADVIVVAVPSGSIADALGRVQGTEGKPAIDTTNAFHGRDERFPSLAHEVKSIVGGPTAKAFNTNYAVLFDRIREQRVRPSCLYCGDDEVREITEQLIGDAGYEPVSAGDLEQARALEDFLTLSVAVNRAGLGQFFCRFAKPGEL
jgi:predicted dinucleotide-binding enzyme